MRLRVMMPVLTMAVLSACTDSTPGLNPFEECTVTFILQPAEINVARGDSVLFRARRLGFCDQVQTSVALRLEDTLVATLGPVSDSTAVVRGATVGSTWLYVVDRADTLHQAAVNVTVRQ